MPIQHIRAKVHSFLQRTSLRLYLLLAIFAVFALVMIYRLFTLQIVRGESYQDNFTLRIRKEVTIPSTRGNIYDRNGVLLAYNELAYSVTIRDTYEERGKNRNLNETIDRVLDLVEARGDQPISDFGIRVEGNRFVFASEGTSLLRFLADVYGHAYVDDLLYEERMKTPDQVMADMGEKYRIGEYEDPEDTDSTFLPGEGYTPKRFLQLVNIRYNLALNRYQKYLSTPIAVGVSPETVAAILERSNELQGIQVEDSTVRRYTDGVYFSQIIGYTGRISTEELSAMSALDPDYDASDMVGKSGIEAAMERELHGRKGSQVVYVDNLGRELAVSHTVDPVAGNDVYLTIDRDLQEAAYDILEKRLADILLVKLRNIKSYNLPENASSSDIVLPIYDVYNACFANNIISLGALESSGYGSVSREVYEAEQAYCEEALAKLYEEIMVTRTVYDRLPKELKIYQSYFVQYLYDRGVIPTDRVDRDADMYIKWTTEETVSLYDYLNFCIAEGWVDVSSFDLADKYSGSDDVLEALWHYTSDSLRTDRGFIKRLYRFMLQNDRISGEQVCHILMEQGIVHLPAPEEAQFLAGNEDAYTFMQSRIANRDLTPAQLNLDPYSGSIVITDPGSGDVLALVSYPSYDNNRLAGVMDQEYYASLIMDNSRPLFNYATQQRTAPGSTFKMVSATAGLMEGVIDLHEQLECTGTFDKIPQSPHCWIYPNGAHGKLTVTEAIHHSCNSFFYEVGYRLGEKSTGEYVSEMGVEKLAHYADLYGLSETSGIEIEEYSPIVSTEDSVRSAIGQANSAYTTAGLARYVTTVANRGVCYDLTLIDRITNTEGVLLKDNEASIRNIVELKPEYWNAMHRGMREVVEDKSYYDDFPIQVAGKTGTAQEATDRPNHALFVAFAPYDQPDVAVACRVANGYTSDYAAQIVREVLKYYFNLEDRDSLLRSEETLSTGNTGD